MNIKSRLEGLKTRYNVQWRDLADMLEISVPMLGCLRRGERNPSLKLLARIEALENGCVAAQSATQSEQNQPQVDTPRGGAAGLEARLSAVEERLATIERLLLRLAADADAGK